MKITFILFSAFSIFFQGLYSQILPSDLQWNENDTGYYTIKENNIILKGNRQTNNQTNNKSNK